MKHSEIIPAIEAMLEEWRAKYGKRPDIVFRWSLTDDPEPWLKLNNQYMCRASKFDDVSVEEARDKEVSCLDEFHSFLDYEKDFLYIGPVSVYITDSYNGCGGYTLLGSFKIANPGNLAELDLMQEMDVVPEPMRPECAECCRYKKENWPFYGKSCPGKTVASFADLPEGEKPACFRKCPDECSLSDDECPASLAYPPEGADWQ